MKILLISGHGGGDSGACAKIDKATYRECDETINMVKLIQPLIDADVDVYDTSKDCFKLAKTGSLNVRGYDYVLEIHFNACVQDLQGNGYTTGTEIFYPSTSTTTGFEESILKHMCALGFKDRGTGSGKFSVINTCARQGAKANLLEVCFIDDADDMRLYIKSRERVAQAIANGINEILEDNMTGEQIEAKSKEYRCSKTESDWSIKEGAWQKATDKGVVNGKNPQDYISRQELMAVLDRLGLIK